MSPDAPVLRALPESGPARDDPSAALLFEPLLDVERGEDSFLVVGRPADRTRQSFAQVLRHDDGSYLVEHRDGRRTPHLGTIVPEDRAGRSGFSRVGSGIYRRPVAHHARQEIAFLDTDGNSLGADEIDAGAAPDESVRRRARLEQWLPDGGAAAIAGLVFVLVAWLGTSPLTQAVATLFPEADRTLPPTGGSTFGGGGYFGISPHAVVLVSFGTRAVVALIALVLGLRARRSARSALSGACITTASVSLALFVAGAVVMFVGLAQGHTSNFYGVF